MKQVKADPSSAPLWASIIGKYPPTFLGTCLKAIAWSENIVRDWLKSGGMFDPNEVNIDETADRIAKSLGDRTEMKAHNRHVSANKAKALGLKVTMLEDDDPLQERVLAAHHCCIQTMGATTAYKLIANHLGVASISDWHPV